ncbi:ribose 5-phosphate isomerase [Buchnera aphidicola (Cinara tujafilina)]|uniref:Ribose-5-phosphate isomerase A n=1 Tax=Buchnera aphidicola (Cinara tujafilina) TaxID=261317 RepID=F7WZV0_9GAMM|nr:ribose-5-phosphate isomerase RpiA [Buchnera aphidicola]AEH39851.1 ribose 5-phosphate isomerase [Buchnera aphidicola (Cinara tujafilina)]
MNVRYFKKKVALSAIEYISKNSVIGIGSGSTMKYFIKELSSIRSFIIGAVASSTISYNYLRELNIPIIELNDLNSCIDIYIDSADEVNFHMEMIKGGGGALTREKIISTASKKFLCIIDESKFVKTLGVSFPLPIEVIPMALKFVINEIKKIGGISKYRNHFITDNGNCIIDVYNLTINQPVSLEKYVNNIPGVVCVGIFAIRKANILLISDINGVRKII